MHPRRDAGPRPAARSGLLARFARSSEQAAYFGTQIWLVYSLILSLVAVGGWSEYQAATEKVSREVSTIEVLQRRAVLYPEPMRTQMDDLVRDYARAVADERMARAAGRPAPLGGQGALRRT